MPDRLTDDEVAAALEALDGWSGGPQGLTRTITLDAGEVEPFLADLEVIAREMKHDPDIARNDTTVTLTMVTHSAGGVTSLDVAYAHKVNELLNEPR
jgi:4a-hydroxytetrahydrobiopterin dehydratase